MKRRLFVASSLAALGLTGCGPIKAGLNDPNGPMYHLLDTAQGLNFAVIGTHGMAREYTDADVDRDFRLESLDTPSDATYATLRKDEFRSYVMPVDGLVERPQTFTLAHLRAIPQRAQITRHDCVEGWSQIGKWSGVPLATILAMVQPKPDARYAIFSCFDKDESGTQFYGSLDLHQAAHPQTLLALDLNDKPLDPDHGAPVRLKVPLQLGYKSSKWVRKITLASTFKNIGAGQGGYWEDNGYAWYAGI